MVAQAVRRVVTGSAQLLRHTHVSGRRGKPLPPPRLPELLTVCGDVNFLRKLCHIHFKPVLNVIEDFGIILIRHKSDSQALGAKATRTGHLQRQEHGSSHRDTTWGI